ncbi:hypothetical protein B0H14DRAFT_3856321 [Mycena olivaceomarginata]|nr:hypothetical protein B0H14DRAFT_3856321 [Mycena olivaceomarginata]
MTDERDTTTIIEEQTILRVEPNSEEESKLESPNVQFSVPIALSLDGPAPPGYVARAYNQPLGFKFDGMRATVYSFKGVSPNNIDPSTGVQAVYEIAALDGKLNPLRFLDAIALVDPDRPVRWSLAAEWRLDGTGAIFQFMPNVLGLKHPPTVTLEAQLSLGNGDISWTTRPKINSLILVGRLKDSALELFEHVALTEVGMRLITYERRDWKKSSVGFGFTVFGTLDITIPKQSLPLKLNCEITKFGDAPSLYATLRGDIWMDAFGVEGLGGPFRPAFDVSALFQAEEIAIILTGYISADKFAVSARIERADWTTLNSNYKALRGEDLNLPPFEFYLGSFEISVSSQQGFRLEVSGLLVHDFELDSASIICDDNCGIAVSLGPKGRQALLAVTGEISHGTMPPTCLPAALRHSGQPARIAVLSSGIRPSRRLFDVVLQECRIVAATKEPSPNIVQSMGLRNGDSITKGVSIYAAVQIDAVHGLLPSQDAALTLSAGYQPPNSFDLGLRVASMSGIKIRDDLYTEGFSLAIKVAGDQSVLSVNTSPVIKPFQQHPEGLIFQLGLDVSRTKVNGKGKMLGHWENPLGMGRKVRVLDVLLEIGITLPSGQPLVTIGGALWIGKAKMAMLMIVSPDPMRCFFHVSVQSMDRFKTSTFFANEIKEEGAPYPLPEPDLLHINQWSFTYVRPPPLYPTGLAGGFDGVLFGKHVHLEGSVYVHGFQFKGAVDAFRVGPLQVKSSSGAEQAKFEVTMMASEQKILVDAAVEFFNCEFSVFLLLQGFPNPIFSLDLTLRLGGDPPRRQGQIEGYFEQKVIDALAAELEQIILAITTEISNGLNAAKNSVQELRNSANEVLQRTRNDLEAGRVSQMRDPLTLRSEEVQKKLAQIREDKGRNPVRVVVNLDDLNLIEDAFDSPIRALETVGHVAVELASNLYPDDLPVPYLRERMHLELRNLGGELDYQIGLMLVKKAEALVQTLEVAEEALGWVDEGVKRAGKALANAINDFRTLSFQILSVSVKGKASDLVGPNPRGLEVRIKYRALSKDYESVHWLKSLDWKDFVRSISQQIWNEIQVSVAWSPPLTITASPRSAR